MWPKSIPYLIPSRPSPAYAGCPDQGGQEDWEVHRAGDHQGLMQCQGFCPEGCKWAIPPSSLACCIIFPIALVSKSPILLMCHCSFICRPPIIQLMYKNASTGAEAFLYKFRTDKGMTWDSVLELYRKEVRVCSRDDQLSGLLHVWSTWETVHLPPHTSSHKLYFSARKTSTPNLRLPTRNFTVARSNTPMSSWRW